MACDPALMKQEQFAGELLGLLTLLFIINPIKVAIKIYRLRQQNFDNFF